MNLSPTQISERLGIEVQSKTGLNFFVTNQNLQELQENESPFGSIGNCRYCSGRV